MAITLMQKIRLWWRGAGRRREERDRDFLAKNASWAPVPAARPAVPAKRPATPASIDRDGLQAAYLDQSGQIAYYLDVESGDVIEVRDGKALVPPRHLRVPTQSDEEDRRAFIATLEGAPRERLANASSFRASLATDRALERAFYNFKITRAIEAVEKWLASIGM